MAKRIVFMGTPAAAVPSLERVISDGHDVAAIFTQPDRASGRGNRVTFSPVKKSAIRHQISVFQPTKVRTVETLELVRSFAADLLVVVAYGRILPEELLNSFPLGAVNVHFSLLPKLRGAAPVNWAIVNGETRTGVTTMQMDSGLDTGAILIQSEVEIGSAENAVELMDRLSVLGAETLSDTLRDLDSIIPVEQQDELASYAPMLNRPDGEIDWSMPSKAIVDRIRGFQPFPTSYTYWNGLKITIWAAEAGDPADSAAGTVVSANGDELRIGCGDEMTVIVSEIQAEGKRRVPTRDFLNGHKISVGDKLGRKYA